MSVLGASVLCLTCACSSENIVIKTADGIELSAADVDKDPLRLLPAGALAIVQADAEPVLRSAVGARLLALAERVLPLPASANFHPAKDVSRVVVGLYSFAGVDFAGVATGSFDLEAIEKAADGIQLTPLGSPLVKMQYSKWKFYVSANVGFALLTPHTAVFGNEAGIRRVLDRLERGNLERALGKELQTLLEKPGAPVAFGVDAATDPQVAALAERAAFLHGMSLLRGVANFEAPGFNLAATLTYPAAAAAADAKGSIEMLAGVIQGLGAVSSLFGGSQPLQRFEATTVKSSLQVLAATDTKMLEQLLDLVPAAAGSNPTKAAP
jgi:hypothetical protein